jgi:hypothetical protein
MWQPQIKSLNSDRIQQITILQNDRAVTYNEVIKLWQENSDFRVFWISLLKNAPFTAYFWETPPINNTKIDRLFEFVLIDSSQLARVNSEPRAFASHFAATDSNQPVITFLNLNGDACLVVPCPIADLAIYPHLASFIRQAPIEQQHALWQTVGNAIKQKLNDRLMWVSTAGLGVYWLHIRLDSFPKYYRFTTYKKE